MALSFSKYEGLGNDFIVVDARTGDVERARRHARELCERHRGVGGDGVLLVDAPGGLARMQVINADGSRPEMCGNGLRCVALHLLRTGFTRALAFEVQTGAGPHRCALSPEGRHAQVEVSMRPPSLQPEEVPVVASGSVLDEPFALADHTLRFTCVSMGNPHAVTFDEVGEARLVLGPLFERHPRFPRGANIGFARVDGPQRISLAVFERGAGLTQACGTGACAAAVAAVETGRARRHEPIEVTLPGGALRITVAGAGERVQMTGPARHVFDGVWEP